MQPASTSRKRSRSIESPVSSSSVDSSPLSQLDPPVNMLHAELFYHLSTETLPSLSMDGSNMSILPTEVINYGLAAPYLLNELMALAALHLAILREGQRDFYRHHSTELQNHALRIFHGTEIDASGKPSVPAFLFSSILGLHLLCDTLVFRDQDFQIFLGRFVHYLRIHRGVRTIIGGNWRHLKETIGLKSVLAEGEASLQMQNNDTETAAVCRGLLARIRAAKLGPAITATYEQAIEALQQSMNAGQSGVPADKRHVVAWSVMISVEFADMLVHRRPEALVILAHYAVLLHSCRDMWMFCDGSRFLIESIDQYLGPEWAEWLEWPRHVLKESTSGRLASGTE